ncbi:MAG: tRNA (adenosine(37)-N6)-threonylcarbamoyltransferase complex dimerization subunit type 1 TsaB [Acidobacteriota bacterium]
MRTTTPILAIDTASPSPAVTLAVGGREYDEALPGDRQASERLLGAIEECSRRAAAPLSSFGLIAVCSGPGSFTGVRVGLATAWGLGRALGVRVEAVSTLDAIAEAARADGLDRVAAALDAGRGEIVWQAFDLGGPRARPFGASRRETPERARDEAGDLPFASRPAGLVPGPAIDLPPLLSPSLARAAARAPSLSEGALAAIYSRPSAAEEKRGAP